MLRYFVNDVEVSPEDFDSQLEDAVTQNVEAHYDDILDECYEIVKIGGCTFYASEILKNCDPVAYRCGVSDEVSYRLDDARYDFEDEYEDTIFGTDFRTEYVDEDEDEEEE